MKINKQYTVAITDDVGNALNDGDTIMFVFAGRTRLATYKGLDNRSRVVLKDYITNETYTCMIGSITMSKRVEQL